jgi:hypothetical protein
MVPTVAFPFGTPFTLQVTALLDPVTLGMNCTLVLSRTVAAEGEMLMETLEELLLPHPAAVRPTTSGKQSHANRAFMLLSPISMTFLARWARPGSSFRMSG